VIGAVFGLVRAVPVLTMAPVTTPARLRRVHQRMHRWAPWAARAAVGVQCAAAAVAVAGVVRP